MTAAPTVSLARDTAAPGFDFLLQGSAQPFATVLVEQVGRGPVGAAFADSSGYWGLGVPDAELAQGEFRFRASAIAGENNRSAPAEAVYRPNFVLVNTDDMAAHDLKHMPLVNQLLVGSGTTFTNSFVPTALSGPSRAALLTGQYAHSNGGFEGFAPLGGTANYHAAAALPNLLHAAGYRTAAFGKNETSPDTLESSRPGDPPPGWDEFSTGALNPGDSTPNGFYYFRDGVRTVVPNEPGGSTEVWTKLSESFIRQNSSSGSPFMLYFAPGITHRPYVPAPQHAGSMKGVPNWRPPSFNVVPPDVVNLSPKSNLAALDLARQRHLETLLSVDDAVGRLYAALAASGELDNTIFVFTADNGLLWGEHAMFSLKNNFFDESLRVPLVIRDGRQPQARVASQMALNIDIAPTFAQLAGIALPSPIDGRNLLPAIHDASAPLRSAFIMEHQWSEGYDFIDQGYGTGGVGIRTNTWKYVEYQSGKRDLFNLANDPFEMRNLAKNPAYASTRQQLASQMRAMLPADNLGPVITSLAHFIEFDEKGLPYLRVVGEETDAASGGSPVRTPEYFIDHVGNPGWGQPLDHTDGSFDAVTENFQGRIPLSTLAQLGPGPHTLYVRGRDVVGNWGPLRSRTFELPSSLQLDFASDTGASNTDGLTLDSTPTLHGVATPGAVVAIFGVRPDGKAIALGKAVADLTGSWTKTVTLGAGTQHIVGVMTGSEDASPAFTAALAIHVGGVVESGKPLRVVGGSGNDDILVDSASSPGKVIIRFNGIVAGVLAWTGPVQIDGLAGDDLLTLRGNLPGFLNGGAGNDVLRGGSGSDVLRGDGGNNQLIGGIGDDRYLFSPPGVISNNIMVERAGEGYDTLDFSLWREPVIVDLSAVYLGRDRASRFTARAAAGTPVSYEALRSSAAGGVLGVPDAMRVVSSGGNDQISVQTRFAPGTTKPLRTLSVSDIADSKLLRCFLATSVGTLRVSFPAWGVPASQVQGNGANRVVLTGTRAQINATLRAFPQLHVPAGVTFSALAVDLELWGSGLLEHSTTTIRMNAPPVLSLPGSATYFANRPPVVIGPQGTVRDTDGNLAGGILRVALAGGGAGDRLGIHNAGRGTGQIGIAGNAVTIGGAVLGTFSGGSGNSPLVIQLTSPNTAVAAVQRLLRSITFRTTDAPSGRLRTITFQLTDGPGGLSNQASVRVRVRP